MEKNEENEKKSRPFISKLIILFLFIGMIYLYARYVEPQNMTVKEYNLINENIPSNFDGFSIVQFSDIELGSTFFLDDLKKLVTKINEINPDIVVFTCDIVSNSYTLKEK